MNESLASAPWTEREDWRENQIPSGEKRALWLIWGFAILWNLFTLPFYIFGDEIWTKVQEEPVVLVAFIFPVIGVGLLASAIHLTRSWRRFGRTLLVMDPFPGSIGGQVGGTIATSLPPAKDRRFDVSLRCVRSYVSGSGKNRSRKETIRWSTDGICLTEIVGGYLHLKFRFDVPSDQPASDAAKSSDYMLWRLQIDCEMDGPDFNRSWEVPVFDTGRAQSSIAEGSESHPEALDAAMAGIESIADIRQVPGGIEAWYPPFQRPAQGIFTGLFGLVFFGIGVALGVMGESWLLCIIFSLVGGLVALFGIYYLGKGLMVSVTRDEIRSRRFLFGYRFPVHSISSANLRDIEIAQAGSMRSGNNTTVYYQVFAHSKDRSAKKLMIGERLTSKAEAELLRESYYAYLGKGG